MTNLDIDALRQSHSPQPLGGAVADGLHIAREKGMFYLYDSRQTEGYLCTTQSVQTVIDLLIMEEHSKGSVRTLITGEPSPYNHAPPTPAQQTFTGVSEARINIAEIM